MFPSQAVSRVMPFVLSVLLAGLQTSQGCCSFLPGNLRAGFKDRRGRIPSEKVTASAQPESERGCALPAADR